MWKGCPATGRMSHVFDKETHRCRCGRWERGFKPKTEPTKPRAECQICERIQAIDADGTMGNHGYKRPGCGWIQGNCFGHNHKPFPETDALEAYTDILVIYIAGTQDSLNKLPSVSEMAWKYETGAWKNREKHVALIKRGEVSRYEFTTNTNFPSFEELERRERVRLESEISHAKAELKRVEARIEKAKGMVAA